MSQKNFKEMKDERLDSSYKYLQISNVSQCSKEGSAYLAILQETDGKRMLPVLMERQDALMLLLKMKKVFVAPTPIDLSDIMLGVFNNFSLRLREVRICAVRGGVTYCHLHCEQFGERKVISYCRASNGLVLAATFKCPITIPEELLEMQYMREVADGTYSMPINSVSKEALEEALKRAVETENYELASLLRDEIQRRK